MGMLSRWIARRQTAQGSTTPESEPALSRIADGALSPRLAQEQQIHRKVAAYRAQLQREAAARQAREAQAERARLQRAQAEFEDDCARSLAEGFGHFPARSGRGGGATGPAARGHRGRPRVLRVHPVVRRTTMAMRRKPKANRPELLKAKWPADFLICKRPEPAPAKAAVPPESSSPDSASKADAKETP